MKLIEAKQAKEFASTFLADKILQAAVNAVVDNCHTADAVKVVHGRWEKAEYHGFLRCSECKDVYIDDTWVADGKWNYCHNCGAKMDGGTKVNE